MIVNLSTLCITFTALNRFVIIRSQILTQLIDFSLSNYHFKGMHLSQSLYALDNTRLSVDVSNFIFPFYVFLAKFFDQLSSSCPLAFLCCICIYVHNATK